VPPHVSSLEAAWRCCAPTQHLSESDLHHVVEAMPPALQRLFRPCTQHQTAYGPEGFLRRVAAHLVSRRPARMAIGQRDRQCGQSVAAGPAGPLATIAIGLIAGGRVVHPGY
jgi:hypothetical protein